MKDKIITILLAIIMIFLVITIALLVESLTGSLCFREWSNHYWDIVFNRTKEPSLMGRFCKKTGLW